MIELANVLGRGYFPKELPPPFKSITFGNTAAANADQLDAAIGVRTPTTRAAVHNLVRAGDLRRKLAVPNPLNYFRLSRYLVTNWPQLSAHVQGSVLSISTPVVSPIGRALNPRVLIGDLPSQRASHRATVRYVLFADVARCHPSIYTHSIPWALHGKAVAKANRAPGLLGNDLDTLMRSAQDGQTNGIPIGPDISLVVAEIVLSAADLQITNRLRPCGFRHLDDYELGFTFLSEAETALAVLEEVLNEYELALNSAKTRIVRLPDALEDDWVSDLNRVKIRSKGHGQRTDLIAYFNRAFELAKTRPRDPVLSYAVASLRKQTLEADHGALVQDLVLQTALSEPATLRFSLELLIRHRAAGLPIEHAKVATALNSLVTVHAPLGHGSEVIWALWAAIALDIPLAAQAAQALVGAADPFVGVVACDALQRGVLTGPDLWKSLRRRMLLKALTTEDWVLAYEGDCKGWCHPSRAGYTAKHPFFRILASNDVVFYDSATELTKIEKRIEDLTELRVPVLGLVFGY